MRKGILCLLALMPMFVIGQLAPLVNTGGSSPFNGINSLVRIYPFSHSDYTGYFKADYYVSVNGNDNNTGTYQKPFATPGKALSVAQPGDTIYIRAGVYPSVDFSEVSGTFGNKINLWAYPGEKPVISGFQVLTSWTSSGINIYRTYLDHDNIRLLELDRDLQMMGRTPNGYYFYENSSGVTQITDNDLPASPNWTGADAVLRKADWISERVTITNHTDHTLTVEEGIFDLFLTNGYGYFISNDIRTLDQNGEWYYKPSADSLFIYLNDAPSNHVIRVSNADTVITVNSDYVSLKGLSIEGGNFLAVNLAGSYNIDIDDCSITNSYVGIDFGPNTNRGDQTMIKNTSIRNCLKNGIQGDGSNALISASIKRIGLLDGMMFDDAYGFNAINFNGYDVRITKTVIDSVGYDGISFALFGGDNYQIDSCLIQNWCMVLNDGAGIYTYSDETNSGKKIINNFVMNASPDMEAMPTGWANANGIYCDETAADVLIKRNTVANIPYGGGIFLHGVNDIVADSNTVFNADYAFLMTPSSTNDVSNISFKHNKLLVLSEWEDIFRFGRSDDVFNTWGNADSNYYFRPSAPDNIIRTVDYDPYGETERTLAQWRTLSGQDAHTISSPLIVSSTDSVFFTYNYSADTIEVGLESGLWETFDRDTVETTIKLAPYQSQILVKAEYHEGAPSYLPQQNFITHYYNLNETTGDALDLVGSNNLTVSGATQNSTGVMDAGYSLDGDNDQLVMTSAMTAGLSELTISMLVYPREENYNGILLNETSNTGNWQCVLEQGGWWTRDASSGPTGDIYSNLVEYYLTPNQWHHIVAVYSVTGGYKGVYVDGVLAGSTAVSIDQLTTERYLNAIGGEEWSSYYFYGYMDDIVIWNKALTGTEIQSLKSYYDGYY